MSSILLIIRWRCGRGSSRRTRHCGSCDLPYWCHARAIADGGRSEGEPGLRPRIGNEGFRAMQSCTFERDTAHGHSCQDSDWRVQTPVTVEFISNVFGGSRSFAGNLSASLKRPRKRELEPRLAALSTLARCRRGSRLGHPASVTHFVHRRPAVTHDSVAFGTHEQKIGC